MTSGFGDQRSIRAELRARGNQCNNLQRKREPKSCENRPPNVNGSLNRNASVHFHADTRQLAQSN